MAIKISKAAKDLNVGIPTLVEFLKKNNQNVENGLNSRITDEQYDMLVKEFKTDKDLKSKSEQQFSSRQKEKAKPASQPKPEEIKTVIEPISKPKVVGKIDLDNAGKPKPQEQQPEPEKKPEQAKVEAAKPSIPAPVNEKPKKQAPEKSANKSIQMNADGTEIITVVQQIAAPKIVGKINLDEINQQTRPKKKTKDEKRKERILKEKERTASGNEQKKKRKRIGKEKIDIENSSNQMPQSKDDNQKRNAKNKDRQKPKRHIKPEVSDEDVQKQIKETLARLTNKPQKKSAKWRKEKREAYEEREREEAEMVKAESKVLRLTEFVTANDLALMMDVPVNKVIATCMSLGVMVSINQRLDAETINIVAEEFGFKTEYVSAEVSEAITEEADKEEDLRQRPPIVTVMGHVDHGKTSLLDYIRNSNVIAGEAGGITQHIGAYNVKLEDGRRITFLDTPGHEAFTAMRARGAKVTDIAIIIVAADDNVMPQTIEAINHASAAGVPIVFAINKIDKPDANPDKIKEELANMNYLVEDWGGKYQSQEISAKKGIGVAELMEKVLLEAEMLDLKANPDRKATGSVIESSLDKGRGYVATVLVSNGTLHVGDIMVAGTNYGKIRAMFNERNQRITEAGPSAPALVLGLNGAPTAGDTFHILDSEREAREITNRREQLQREQKERTRHMPGLDDIARRRALGEFHELNLIVKGDVDGSIEALSDSLIKLSTPEVQVNVIHKAVGAISESDVTLAAASDAVIIGFQVRPSVAAKRLAENEGVDIRLYSIIYDAIEEVKDAMEGMLSPDIKEEITGTAEVLQTYKISRVGTIAGCMVREGKIKRTSKVRLIRDGIVIYTGELGSLKRFKDDVKEVASGYDCGLNISNYNDVKEGDMIEAFEEVAVSKKL
ncbi:MAG: translation initiation factor IF-2 [Bacteroidetes bacterium]|uniref:Translation initiation factor IF-2 n=1 Tax=Candidatus Limisoma faecipullorum TaxID=2840854 RepID=A0A9D9NJR7_9BACT|nr:translation initiation factor IF-2 [Candidatus Limisoma faecipullorum]